MSILNNPKATITEPMTMITDYLITIELFIFIYLLRSDFSDRSVILFSLLFFTTGVGAFAGGTSHGFTQFLGERGHEYFWFISVQSITLGTTLFELAVITNYFSNTAETILIIVVVTRLVGYVYWLLQQEESKFLYVVLNYGTTMIFTLLYLVYEIFISGDTAAGYLIAGIVITFAAAGVQQSGYGIHKHFNHNDIYHLIQMIAFYFFYLAVNQFNK